MMTMRVILSIAFIVLFFLFSGLGNADASASQNGSVPPNDPAKEPSIFRYNDDRYIASNTVNLKDISARVLAGWEKRGWIEPYSGSLAAP
jgi:uncharacterized protein with FMN-binding domain